MILIGISGKKRSGKNTVAKQIATLTNQSVEEFAFARELKLELANMMKVPVKDIEQKKELYRPLLQALGTYRKQTNDDYYWVRKVYLKILSSSADVCIVTDVRYKVEADTISQAGGVLIRVNRNTSLEDNHLSETELDNYDRFDIIINNDLTLEHLLSVSKKICNQLNIKLK